MSDDPTPRPAAPSRAAGLAFDRACAIARLSAIEHLLIQEALEAACGGDPAAKLGLATLDAAAISRRCGSTPQSVNHALRWLVAERILIRYGDAFRINDQYREWVDLNGKPLLDADQIAFCERGLQPGSAPGRPAYILVDW